MNLSEKGTIKKVIDGTSSGENARCVVEWFSSTIEGQQFLSDMIDRDAYLMEEEFPGQKEYLLFNRKLSYRESIKKFAISVMCVWLV